MAKAKKLPSGNWRVQLYVGKDETGKKIYRSFTASSKREAELAAAEYVLNAPTLSASLEMTLGEAMDKYIEIKSNVLSPSTLRSYHSIRRNRIQQLMNVKLCNLTSEIIQAEFNLEAATLSPKTIRNVHGLLTAALALYAPKITLNIRLPQKEKKAVRIPSRAEINAIYAHVKDTEMEIPFLLASQCGLRLSEICALTPADIGDGAVIVNKAMVIGDNGYTIKKPKSFAGYRTVTCDRSLTDLIRSRTSHSDERVVKLSYLYISEKWSRITERLHIENCRFHDLRHYFASEGLLLDIPPKYLAELMGHASVDMVNRVYGHTFADQKATFAKALADKTADLLHPCDSV